MTKYFYVVAKIEEFPVILDKCGGIIFIQYKIFNVIKYSTVLPGIMVCDSWKLSFLNRLDVNSFNNDSNQIFIALVNLIS